MCLTKSAIHSKRTPLMSPLFCTHQQPWCDTLSRCTLPSLNWVWVSSARKAKAHPNYILNGNIFSTLSSTLQTSTHAQYILLLPIKNIYRLLHIQRSTMYKYGIAVWKGTCFRDLCFSFKPFFAYRICLFWHPHNNNRLSDRLLKDVVLSIHSFFTFWDVLIDLWTWQGVLSLYSEIEQTNYSAFLK